MALDQMQDSAPEADVSDEDVEITTRLGLKLLTDGGGLEIIGQALKQSQDSVQVIGQFLAQMIGQMAEQLQGEINMNPNVYLAKNGFLENILDYIEAKLGMDSKWSDEIWAQVIEVIKAAAINPEDKNTGAPGMPQTPVNPQTAGGEPMPQGGPPLDLMGGG